LFLNRNNEPTLYDELNRWTKVKGECQMLFFKDSSLTEFASNNILDVCSLPTTSDDIPIILCNKDDEDIKIQPIKVLYEKQLFPNRVDTGRDYEIAKHNCSVAYYQKRLISDIVSRVKLVYSSVETINQVVIRQLTLASKDNFQIHNTVHSLTRQFDMMKDFQKSCQSFLVLVSCELKEGKQKIIDNKERAYAMEHVEFQNLLKKLQLLNPSIESLLKERVENRQLLRDWETASDLIPVSLSKSIQFMLTVSPCFIH